MKKKDLYWAIPGFLGHSEDWKLSGLIEDVYSVNYHSIKGSSLKGYGKEINQIRKQCHVNTLPILLGYSFGGRLALHAAIENPTLWKAAIFISVHPGLHHQSEKRKRLSEDLSWAIRFLNDDWNILMKEWNQRGALAGDSFQFMRKESDYERSKLAHLLVTGSLGHQEDLREEIKKIPIPILWIVGEKDSRFKEAANSLIFQHPLSKSHFIAEAKHRIPWSHPRAFQESIENFGQLIG